MTRCSKASLTLAVLALTLTACTTKSNNAVAAWHSSSVVAGQGGGQAAMPSPTSKRHEGRVPARSSGSRDTPDSPSTPGPSPDPTRSGPPKGAGGRLAAWGVISTTGTGNVSLTFDDGPGPYTSQLLDLLDKYQVKATFCLIGRQVQAYADVVRRMVADGMTLCNHTWDHDERLRNRRDTYIRDELERTNAAIQAVAPGAQIEYFRNPGGEFGANTAAIGKSLGMQPLMWNVDPRDWARPGTQAIIANVLKHTHPGSIVLSHDGGGDRSETLAAYRVLLPNLKSRFQLVPLPVV